MKNCSKNGGYDAGFPGTAEGQSQDPEMVFAADVHSVFDICWYTLARKMSEDVAPEDKGTSADKKEKPAGVVMSCPFCGEAFVRRSNRSVICGKPECEKARKAMNQRNSRRKRKIQSQQST